MSKSKQSLTEFSFDGVPLEKEIPDILNAPPVAGDPEYSDIYNWLRGLNPIPPDIANLGENVAIRMNWFILSTTINQYARLPVLLKFVRDAEERIFNNPEPTTDLNKLLELYKVSSTEIEKMLEFTRKFLIQNKDLLKGIKQYEDEDYYLLDKIKSLNPEDLEKLKTVLENI